MARMSRDAVREEIREFKEQWELERRNYPGGWVPATALLNTGPVLRELLDGGHITANGIGFKPTGRV